PTAVVAVRNVVAENENGEPPRIRGEPAVVEFALRVACQCTLTACNSLLQAFAIAASRLSVSMIGVPSAAWSANSLSPGAIFGAWGKSPGTSSERICFT